MVRSLKFLALGTLAMAAGAFANDDAGVQRSVREATPVKLVEFNGGWEVLKTSTQLRVWRSHLNYTIAVDAEGKPTSCSIDDEFRRAYVNQKLCSVLVKTHVFEPAHDAAGVPVAGDYKNSLSYLELREKS